MFASHASLSAYQWSAFTFGWLLLHRPINSTGWGPVNFTAITFTTAKDYSSSRRAKRFCLTKLTDAAFHRRAAFIHVALVQEAPVRTCLKMPKWNFVIWSIFRCWHLIHPSESQPNTIPWETLSFPSRAISVPNIRRFAFCLNSDETPNTACYWRTLISDRVVSGADMKWTVIYSRQ